MKKSLDIVNFLRRPLGTLALAFAVLGLLAADSWAGELSLGGLKSLASTFAPSFFCAGKRMNDSNHTVVISPRYNKFRRTYGPTDVMGGTRHVDDWRQDWNCFYEAKERTSATSVWTRAMGGTNQWRILYYRPNAEGGTTSSWQRICRGLDCSATNGLISNCDQDRTLTGLKSVHRKGNRSDREIRDAEEATEKFLRLTDSSTLERIDREDAEKKKKQNDAEGALNHNPFAPKGLCQLVWQPALAASSGVQTASAPIVSATRRSFYLSSMVLPMQGFLRGHQALFSLSASERRLSFAYRRTSSKEDAHA